MWMLPAGDTVEILGGLLAPLQGRRILDIGCGRGNLLQALAERGASVAGLDPDAIIGFGSEDVVDLTELVSIGPGDNVADYVRLNPGNSTQLQVDADGTAGSEDWVTVATFDVPQTPSTIKILYEDDGSDNSGTV